MAHKVVNFVLFQLGWLAVVLLGTGPYHWLGLVVVAAIVAYHLATSASRAAEARLVFMALLIGLVWENALTLSGVLSYPHGQLAGNLYGEMPGHLAPLWIVAMWGMLATTLNVSLRWLHGRMLLAALFGAIGGPLAFFAGERLGAVTFSDPPLAMAVLAIAWAALFALLMTLAQRYDGAVTLNPEPGRASS
jgi:hypothetical protein